jgi:hypothetical protein
MVRDLINELKLNFKKEKLELTKKPSKLNEKKIEEKLMKNMLMLNANPELE